MGNTQPDLNIDSNKAIQNNNLEQNNDNLDKVNKSNNGELDDQSNGQLNNQSDDKLSNKLQNNNQNEKQNSDQNSDQNLKQNMEQNIELNSGENLAKMNQETDNNKSAGKTNLKNNFDPVENCKIVTALTDKVTQIID